MHAAPHYYLGIDAGATKTHALIADQDGHVHGERFRTFGEGQVLGDVGGAGDIAWLAMRAIAHAYTGRGRPTALSDRFVALCNVDGPLQLIEGLCRGTVQPLHAAHAPVVFEVAAEGDEVAREIIRYVGHELGANAAAIAGRLGMLGEPFELVLAGGVFRSESELLIDALLKPVRAVAPRVQPTLLRTAPVAGSVLLAMDADGLEVTAGAQERLAEETRLYLERGSSEP